MSPEDCQRFFHHRGIDAQLIGRAARDLLRGEFAAAQFGVAAHLKPFAMKAHLTLVHNARQERILHHFPVK